jgi:hypothetical protein
MMKSLFFEGFFSEPIFRYFPREGHFVTRSILIVGIAVVSLDLVLACGKREEPAKTQKPAAEQKAKASAQRMLGSQGYLFWQKSESHPENPSSQ